MYGWCVGLGGPGGSEGGTGTGWESVTILFLSYGRENGKGAYLLMSVCLRCSSERQELQIIPIAARRMLVRKGWDLCSAPRGSFGLALWR